jgi:nucleotide-binding universal stress UspA family protein
LPLRRYGFRVPTFSKIVAATDFSEDSNLALGYAQELALKFSSDIVLLHVDQPLAPVMMTPELGPAMDVGAMGRIAEEQRMLAQKELDKIAIPGNSAHGAKREGRPDRARHSRTHGFGARPDGQRRRARRAKSSVPGADDSSPR